MVRNEAMLLRTFVVLLALTLPVPAAAAKDRAQAILDSAFTAMGGRAPLLNVRSVADTAVGTRAMVEQSERPTGPYFVDHYRFTESLNLDDARVRTQEQDWGYAGPQWWLTQTKPGEQTMLVDGGVAGYQDGTAWRYAGGSPLQFAQERVAFGPERVLLTAQQAADLHALPDVDLHGTPYHVLGFTWQGAPCKLTINARTNLPWSIAWTRAYPYYIFYNGWGDVPTTLTFNEWSLEPNGVRYPREWTYERLGLPDQQISIIALAFNAVPDADLRLPADLVAAHTGTVRPIDAIPFPASALTTLAPGVVLANGSWNVGFVRQNDGVVVIEAPISSAYAKQAFAFARTHFGLPVKAVVTTSDSWPHIAGVRQAIAEGIPVYALDLNLPILRRLIASPHTQRPDDLARAPRTARVLPVVAPVTIGSGANALRIIPYRTATAERQMMIDVPFAHALYTSDLFAPDDVAQDGTIRSWFTPEYLDEAISTIRRYGLQPRTIWGMHYGPVPYSTIVDALERFRNAGG
jgi:hypothetical protein